ncbi:hypothetical protein C8R45DRAFT_1075672 [Mycena sanguinolenta]|nr:hypothetical protein C8R45DRAFT_1075672 [Mycena sanguinolenta]
MDILTLQPRNEIGQKNAYREVLWTTLQQTTLDAYQFIRARDVIHNGTKPTLYAIDFGFSIVLRVILPDMMSNREVGLNSEWSTPLLLPSTHGVDAANPNATTLSPSRTSPRTSSTARCPGIAIANANANAKLNASAKLNNPNVPTARIKLATPAALLFRGMPACFAEFWRDVKGLAFAEVQDYETLRGRFVGCLGELDVPDGENRKVEEGTERRVRGWWDVWDS